MSRFSRCRYCGQPLPVHRLGLQLTPLLGRIFDAIEHAGKDGIAIDDLFERIFSDRKVSSRKILHVHVNQLNHRLANVGYQIRSRHIRHAASHEPRPSAYWLVKGERTNPRDKISPRQAKALGL